MSDRTVFLIGPESVVYHATPNCSALSARAGYWPVKRGVLQPDGSIRLAGLSGSYTGRRPCRRCHR